MGEEAENCENKRNGLSIEENAPGATPVLQNSGEFPESRVRRVTRLFLLK